MTDIKQLSFLQIDNGNYTEVAERLGRDFGTGWYYNPHVIDGYPIHIPDDIGEGIKNVTSVRNWYPYAKKADLIFFSDLYEDMTQEALRNEGKVVFGLGAAQEIETNRVFMKKWVEESGLPINDYEVIQGLTALREYLKDKQDKYIKTNYFRGEGETFKFVDYDISQWRLDKYQANLGINKETELFIVEDPIPDAVEIGYDGFVMDGLYPNKTLFGVEVKDCSYGGIMIDYDRLPASVKRVNRALAPYFQKNKSRATFSTEIRQTKNGKGYLIDMCCRQPQPPTSLQLEMYKNYPSICYDIARGIMPTIEENYRYGVQIIIKINDVEEGKPQAIKFDEQYKNFIKIKNLSIKNGRYYYLPQNSMHEIGAIIGVGSSLNEAIKMAKKVAETVKGDCLTVNTDALSELKKELERLNDFGINIF